MSSSGGGAAPRFLGLDAMRGVAALAVLAYHIAGLVPGAALLPHGYLAVDFFFVLSGFVLEHAYGARLSHNGSLVRFMRERLQRLYPLMIAGTLLGIAAYAARQLLHQGNLDLRDAATIIVSLFALPAIWTDPFPVNPPMWSLFWELVINFLFAAFYRHLRGRGALVTVMALGLWALVLALLAGRWVELGTVKAYWWAGLPRAGVLFLLGVLIYRMRTAAMLPFRFRPWTMGLLLAPMLWRPVPSNFDLLVDLVAIFLVYPILILLAAESGSRWPRLAAASGNLSYPIYAIHMPIILIAAGVATRLLGADPDPLVASCLAGACVALIIFLAAFLHTYFDLPVRRYLRRSATGKTASSQARQASRGDS